MTELSDNLFVFIQPNEMCSTCRAGEYPVRGPDEPIPAPDDGDLCRRCGVKLRAD